MIRLLDSGLMVSLGTENLAICIKLEDKETIEMQFPLLKRLTITILTLSSVTVIYLQIIQHGLSIRNITSESNAK